MEPGSKPLAGMERGILERNGGWRYSRQESGPVTVLGVPAGGVDYVYSYDRLWAVVYGVEPEHAEQVRHTLETTLGAPDATSPDGVLIWYDEPGTKKWRLRAEYYVTDGVGTVRVEDGKTGGEINALVEQEEREKKTKFPYVLHASCEGPGGLTLPVGGCFPNSTVKVRTESATKVYGTVEMLGMLTNNEEFTLGLPPHFEIAASNSGQRGMRLHVWITDRADKKHFEDYAERFGWVKVAN